MPWEQGNTERFFISHQQGSEIARLFYWALQVFIKVIPRDTCLLSPSVLPTTEHSDRVGGRGGVEWHWQMLHKSGPIHQPAWVSGLEKDEASAPQIPWQRPAHQVRCLLSLLCFRSKSTPSTPALLLASPDRQWSCVCSSEHTPWTRAKGGFSSHTDWRKAISAETGGCWKSLSLHTLGKVSLKQMSYFLLGFVFSHLGYYRV